MITFISSAKGWILQLQFLYKNNYGIKWTRKVDVSFNKETNPNSKRGRLEKVYLSRW